MKLGLDSYTTRNSGLDPVGVLNLASELGLPVTSPENLSAKYSLVLENHRTMYSEIMYNI